MNQYEIRDKHHALTSLSTLSVTAGSLRLAVELNTIFIKNFLEESCKHNKHIQFVIIVYEK